jgi:hydrogenase maturation protease
MKRILIAGIGNIFLGDDAFGCEVVNQLSNHEWKEDVRAIDFGIRSYDLAYALTGNYDVVILVDAAPHGEAPATVYLMEIDLNGLPAESAVPHNAHSLDTIQALQMAQSLGNITAKIYLVGCEPAVLESDGGEIGLSENVRAAVPQALAMIESLARGEPRPDAKTEIGFVPV